MTDDERIKAEPEGFVVEASDGIKVCFDTREAGQLYIKMSEICGAHINEDILAAATVLMADVIGHAVGVDKQDAIIDQVIRHLKGSAAHIASSVPDAFPPI